MSNEGINPYPATYYKKRPKQSWPGTQALSDTFQPPKSPTGHHHGGAVYRHPEYNDWDLLKARRGQRDKEEETKRPPIPQYTCPECFLTVPARVPHEC